MISSTLTQGMSTVEVWIVMLAANATERELCRLRKFFNEFAGDGESQ